MVARGWLRAIWGDRAAFADKRALILWGLKNTAFRRKELERWRSALRDVEVQSWRTAGTFRLRRRRGGWWRRLGLSWRPAHVPVCKRSVFPCQGCSTASRSDKGCTLCPPSLRAALQRRRGDSTTLAAPTITCLESQMTTREPDSPVLLLTIAAPFGEVRIADLDFDEFFFLDDETEFTGWPINATPRLQHDKEPPGQTRVRIDVPPGSESALCRLPDGSVVTASFCDQYSIPVSWEQRYVLMGTRDVGGAVDLDLIEEILNPWEDLWTQQSIVVALPQSSTLFATEAELASRIAEALRELGWNARLQTLEGRGRRADMEVEIPLPDGTTQRVLLEFKRGVRTATIAP